MEQCNKPWNGTVPSTSPPLGGKPGSPDARRYGSTLSKADSTGRPGSRDWYANLMANPRFTLHLKQSAQADLTAQAASIRDRNQRLDIISRIHQKIGGNHDLEAWVDGSPLVEAELLPD